MSILNLFGSCEPPMYHVNRVICIDIVDSSFTLPPSGLPFPSDFLFCVEYNEEYFYCPLHSSPSLKLLFQIVAKLLSIKNTSVAWVS